MNRVRTIPPISPEQPPTTVEVADPIPQVGTPAAAPVPASDSRSSAIDPATVNAVDSLGMGGRTSAAEIPQSRTASFDDKVAETNAGKPVTKAGAPRIELAEAMGRLASAGFTEEAQTKFAKKLASVSTGDAAYMARALREIMPQTQLAGATELAKGFAAHGLRLDPFAKTDSTRDYAMLDRTAFRGKLDEVIGDSNGVLTKGDILTILDMVNNVGDLKDLEFARKELDKRIIAGETVWNAKTREFVPLSIDKSAATFLYGFFDDRLDVKVGNTELGFAARNVRQALVAVDAATNASERAQAMNKLQAAKAVFKRLVARAMDDKSSPDAAQYARRVIDRELSKGSCKTCKLAQDVRTQFVSDISKQLGDRLDRKARCAMIDARVAAHELTFAEAAAMKVAVLTSYTNADFTFTLRDFDLVLHTHLLDAFLEMEIAITESIAREQERANEKKREEERAERRIEEEHRLLERDLERREFETKLVEEIALQSAAGVAEAASVAVTPATANPYQLGEAERARGLANHLYGAAAAAAPRPIPGR